ncbi:16973_t:CDS:1, partial [Gigaspora rosea]
LRRTYKAIKHALYCKATGPAGILNKILQHLSTLANEQLLSIFNGCILTEQISKQ